MGKSTVQNKDTVRHIRPTRSKEQVFQKTFIDTVRVNEKSNAIKTVSVVFE